MEAKLCGDLSGDTRTISNHSVSAVSGKHRVLLFIRVNIKVQHTSTSGGLLILNNEPPLGSRVANHVPPEQTSEG